MLSPSQPDAQSFPTVERLRRGVLLRTLINIVCTTPGHAPSDAFKWDGPILLLYDYSNTQGCVAFTPAYVVAAFFYTKSERSPFGEDTFPPYDAEQYFVGAPQSALAVARQAVLPRLESWSGDPALIDQAFEDATIELDMTKFVPVITAAFWSEGETLMAVEPWSAVYFHGAHILWQALSDPDPVLDYFADQELVPRERLALARRLYERRLATTEPVLVLTAEEYAELLAPGAPQLAPLQIQLAAVGIALPRS